ncbi:MAG TPA: hypoxanthine phosphoribosyltransferase [Anaerolineales bacterium]|nr:hypoxanthine phosphoribosyltransferase [Anaerolineales bacterium]
MNPNDYQSYAEIARDVREVLLTPEQIAQRISELGRQISMDYADKDLLIVGVLKGVLMFMADLLRQITIPVAVDFIAVSSYSTEARDKGYVRLVKDLEIPITGRNVLFIEDVIDTGLTLNYLLRNLRARSPASLEVCVMFDKPVRRLVEIPLRYRGFDIPDQFVVGYGLDYREKYRNLPFVGLLKAEAL